MASWIEPVWMADPQGSVDFCLLLQVEVIKDVLDFGGRAFWSREDSEVGSKDPIGCIQNKAVASKKEKELPGML